MVGAHTDVTERRRTQAELAAAYATLEQRVRERTRELAVLNSVAEVVSRTLDLRQIMNAALEKTMDALGTEAGAAYRLEQGTLVMMAHRGLSQEFISETERLALEVAMAGREPTVEEPICWPVDEYPESELKAHIRREGLRVMIGAPVTSKSRLLGALIISTRAERSLSDDESSLLTAIGRQVGVAVENARLFDLERTRHEEAERGRAVAEGMRETLAVLNSQHSLEQALIFIVTQTCRLMGSDAASLLRLEPDGMLRIQSAYGLDADYVARMRFRVGHGGAGRALAERRPIHMSDAEAFLRTLSEEPDPRYEEDGRALGLMVARGYRALLSVPLVVKDEDYGGITLYWREPRDISEEEMELAMSVADQVALAIENARLRTQAEEAAAFAERSRLARELHDSVTQSLYSVTLYAEAVSRLLTAGDAANAVSHLQELRATAQDALREMRLLIFQLNPPRLEEGGLATALQRRLDAVERRGGLKVALDVEGEDHLEPALARELYQAAQEALNNVVKHARAKQVTVRLDLAPGLTRLEIADDGPGFDVEEARRSGGLGLRGLAERAQRIGATLRIESTPGSGTRVLIEVQAPAG
jgi:two-component system nitrate/nitrite sensor histidine kinase NarX